MEQVWSLPTAVQRGGQEASEELQVKPICKSVRV